MTDIQFYGNNDVIVIPVDYLLHTPENPFCPIDPTCPCHEDHTLIEEVAAFVAGGLMTTQEATDFISGKMI